MRLIKAALLSIPVLALGLADANDASAFGGVFHEASSPTANLAVTGHKIIVSVSSTQTTLWDQISYQGAPGSFAWVLPIKGNATFGVSSDALFRNLDAATEVNFNSPVIDCYFPNSCVFGGATSTGYTIGSGGGSGMPDPAPLTRTAQAVVGPYEIVQLHTSDPAALTTWLTTNSFAIPDDVKPILAAYVAEGFDFLAVKLIPGAAISAMRPVRVTTPGSTPVLPLRMLAVGTGATTPVDLWVIAEARYEATNLSDFLIDPTQLIWNWDTMSSNYQVVAQSMFASSQGKAFRVDVGEPFASAHLQSVMTKLAQVDAIGSGYGESMAMSAPQAAADDLAALFGTLDPAKVWVTRLHGELSHEALATDLTIGPSTSQIPVDRFLKATTTEGTAPMCMTYPPCPDTASGGEDGASAGGGGESALHTSGGCAMAIDGGFSSTLSALSVLAALALLRRRQTR